MAATPKKPGKRRRDYYDYNECRDYLQARYGYKERDYAGRYTGSGASLRLDDGKPYLDFWHWVVENYDVRNGCFITFTRERLEEGGMEDWVREIYTRYLDEFADEKGELEMWCWW